MFLDSLLHSSHVPRVIDLEVLDFLFEDCDLEQVGLGGRGQLILLPLQGGPGLVLEFL
jgi:hypothetical protein